MYVQHLQKTMKVCGKLKNKNNIEYECTEQFRELFETNIMNDIKTNYILVSTFLQ